MEQIHLYTKISNLPKELKNEVIDFIDFLLSKKGEKLNEGQPVFGCAKGLISISSNFEDVIEDFKDYM